MPVAKAKDTLDKTNKELLEEMAKALGNTGQQLEAVIEEMKALEAIMEHTSRSEEYNLLVDRFNELHGQALMRREMLMIHREAIKIYKHSFVDAFYPIPGRKKKRERP